MEARSAPGASTTRTSSGERHPKSILWTGLLLGIGIAAFIDETIFHQLLQWHNFYWATDQRGRILSDGLFHAFGTLLLLWGTVRLWSTPRPWIPGMRSAVVAGVLMGAGGFNVYDGVIQHVLLHLHIVNEYVCPVLNANNSIGTCPNDIPLEVAWIGVGAALLLAGFVLWRQTDLSAPGSGARS